MYQFSVDYIFRYFRINCCIPGPDRNRINGVGHLRSKYLRICPGLFLDGIQIGYNIQRTDHHNVPEIYQVRNVHHANRGRGYAFGRNDHGLFVVGFAGAAE